LDCTLLYFTLSLSPISPLPYPTLPSITPHTYSLTHTHMHIHAHTHVHIYTHSHTHIHSHLHTHSLTHTHTHTQDINDDVKIAEFHRINDTPPEEPPLTQAEIGVELAKVSQEIRPLDGMMMR
jgi:hypothetical protein